MGIFDGILILSDFDGTFAGEGGRIVDRNISAIEYFRANGGHFSFSIKSSDASSLYSEVQS